MPGQLVNAHMTRKILRRFAVKLAYFSLNFFKDLLLFRKRVSPKLRQPSKHK
jgi:hypothetical protein